MILTYLYGPAAYDTLQSAESLCSIRSKCACALPVQTTARFVPGRVRDDGQVTAPEDGGTVSHG